MALGGIVQSRGIEGCDPAHDFPHRIQGIGGLPFPRKLHAGFGCELLERIEKLKPLYLHQELKEIAALAAGAEAVPSASLGRHHKTGGLFLMERTTGLVGAAGTVQGDVASNEFH